MDLPRLVRRCEEVAATYYGEVISALYARQVKEKLLPLLEQARVMTQSYQVVVTNPPYMGKSAMDKKLREYVRRTFPLSNYDLYAVFIEKCGQMLEEGGYQGMITQQSWMFIRSYEKMRRRILQTNTIIHMAHLGTRAFEEISGEVVQTTAWIMQKTGRPRGPGEYVRLTEFGSRKEQAFLEEKETGKHGITYRADSENYFRIPGAPVAYWLSEKMLPLFETTVVSDFATVTNGMFTCDNKRFLRLWYELPRERIAFGCTSKAECIRSGKKWFPYNKGGNFRRWYGNQEYVINFENFGEEIREYRVQSGQSAVFPGQDYYFRESLSWSLVSPSKFGIRYYPPGFVFDIAGSSVFPVREEHLYSLLGTLAGAPAYRLLQVINPTINYQAGDIRSLPVPAACLEGTEASRRIAALAKENIALAKADWNSVETSWDFVRHPLVEEAEKRKGEQVLLKDCFAAYEQETIRRARRLSENEKEIDRLLEGIYGLPEEPESRAASQPAFMGKAEAGREARSLLSYAVGCMFKRFESEAPDKAPAVLLLTKEDILRRLKAFLAGHFGARTVEENLCYLAFAVMSDGRPAQKRIADPKEAEGLLLGYFRRNFFKDHQRLYQKRPIYWLVKSGGKGSYEALIYAHGYNGQTLRQIKASLEPIPDSPEKEAFREKLQALIEEAPRLDPEDGIAANRRKLQAILAD